MLCLGLDSTKAVPRAHLIRTNTPQCYLKPQGLPLPRHRQPGAIALLRGCGSGARATCWAVTHREAAALFTSGRLFFFFFFFPCSPVFPLQLAHCAAGWSSWVECFRLKYNFNAFKSLRSSLPPLPPRQPAPPTRDNLMDYSVGLRGSP